MCGRSFSGRVGHRSGFGPRRSGWKHHHGHESFFGLEPERMSSGAQVVAAASVLVPVALGGLLVVVFVREMFWLVFVFGWMVFPAFGMLARGLAGMSEAKPKRATAESRERELLGALWEHGELSPALAAMHTSLSVAEAEKMLGKLAEGGHLEARVRGGGLYYALWGRDSGTMLDAATGTETEPT